MNTEIDDSQINWTKEQRQQLVRLCILRILILGDQGIGKTSLLKTILQNQSVLTKIFERTVVFDVTSWKLRNGKVILTYDLGGHDAYYYTSQFLHYNCSQNVVLLCQALASEKYDVSFQWLQATLSRSPECFVIPVLTKADDVPHAQISSCVRKFTTELKQLLENEIKVMKKVCGDSKAAKLENYNTLHSEFESRLFVTSVKKDHPCLNNVENLCKYIEELSEKDKYHIEMPKVYEEFYCQLGKIGTVVEERRTLEPSTIDMDEIKIGPELIPSVTHAMVNSEQKVDEGYEVSPEDSVQIEAVNKSEVLSEETISTEHQSSVPMTLSKPRKNDNLDNKTNIAGEKLEQLQREGKIILFDEAAKLYEKISKKYSGSCGDVKECLKQFHSYGLCLWFQGHPRVEKIIFNNFSFFKDLLSSLFHHKALSLPFSELDVGLKSLLFDNFEGKYKQTVERVSRRGLISKKMLKILLHQRKFDQDVDTVMELLQILDIGHYHQAGDEPLLFVPYFVDLNEIPNEIKKKSSHLGICSKNEFALSFQLTDNVPSTFWHHLCVKLMDHLHDPSETQQQFVFRNGLWVTVDNLYLLVRFTRNIVKVVIRGKAKSDSVLSIWKWTSIICHKIVTLIKISWPGLVPEIMLDCSNCNTHQWLLMEMFEEKNNDISVRCDADLLKRIPSLLVRPPSEGMFVGHWKNTMRVIEIIFLILALVHYNNLSICVYIINIVEMPLFCMKH